MHAVRFTCSTALAGTRHSAPDRTLQSTTLCDVLPAEGASIFCTWERIRLLYLVVPPLIASPMDSALVVLVPPLDSLLLLNLSQEDG